MRDAARALTGWAYRPDGGFVVRATKHDNGMQTLLSRTNLCPPPSRAPVGSPRRCGTGMSCLPRPATRRLRPSPMRPRARLPVPSSCACPTCGVRRGCAPPARVRAGDHPKQVLRAVTAMGQTPFNPPSVGGWAQTRPVSACSSPSRRTVDGRHGAAMPRDRQAICRSRPRPHGCTRHHPDAGRTTSRSSHLRPPPLPSGNEHSGCSHAATSRRRMIT